GRGSASARSSRASFETARAPTPPPASYQPTTRRSRGSEVPSLSFCKNTSARGFSPETRADRVMPFSPTVIPDGWEGTDLVRGYNKLRLKRSAPGGESLQSVRRVSPVRLHAWAGGRWNRGRSCSQRLDFKKRSSDLDQGGGKK